MRGSTVVRSRHRVAPSGQSRSKPSSIKPPCADVARRSLQQQQRIQHERRLDPAEARCEGAKAAAIWHTKQTYQQTQIADNSASANSNKRVKTANHTSATPKSKLPCLPLRRNDSRSIIATSSAKIPCLSLIRATATSVPGPSRQLREKSRPWSPRPARPVDDLLTPPRPSISLRRHRKDPSKKSRSRKT